MFVSLIYQMRGGGAECVCFVDLPDEGGGG